MKKPRQPEAFACPVEKMSYLAPFKLTADDHQTWIIIDYSEQSITTSGELCRDKPIKIRSNTGVTRNLEWGTLVLPINQPVPKEETTQETQE